MKYYLKGIAHTQQILLTAGILTLMGLPLVILFYPEVIETRSTFLYAIVHATVFFVMAIRPLADIFRDVPYIRPLVILRKGFGVVSASIIVSFILAKIMIGRSSYFSAYLTPEYWSFTHNAIYAHLADISAIILLITSNKFSKHVLGVWWKYIQKLAYVYFYASGLYVFFSFGETLVLFYMTIVTVLVTIAYIINKKRARINQVLV